MLGLVWDLDKNLTFVCQFVNRFHSYFDPYVDGSTRVVQFFYVSITFCKTQNKLFYFHLIKFNLTLFFLT